MPLIGVSSGSQSNDSCLLLPKSAVLLADCLLGIRDNQWTTLTDKMHSRQRTAGGNPGIQLSVCYMALHVTRHTYFDDSAE